MASVASRAYELRDSRAFRQGLVVLAALVAAVSLSVAAVQAWRFAEIGWRLNDRPSQMPRDNDLDPLAYFVPTAALTGARTIIPPGATYAIVVGQDPPVPDPELIRIVFKMWLLPRRYTADRANAQWIIAYHQSSEDIGVPYRSENGIAPGVNVLEVGR
jgi:hypothetical protein